MMRYYESTAGVFKGIPAKWTAHVLSTPKVLRLGNRTWYLDFVSINDRYNSKSIYYLSEDGRYLIRVSDHWSERTSPRVKACGRIKSCWWELSHSKHDIVGRFAGGIIRLADLQHCG